jgi:hypothetical protein
VRPQRRARATRPRSARALSPHPPVRAAEPAGPSRPGPRVATPRPRPALPILPDRVLHRPEKVSPRLPVRTSRRLPSTSQPPQEHLAPRPGAPRAAFRAPRAPPRSTSRRLPSTSRTPQEYLAPVAGAPRGPRRSTSRTPQEHLDPPSEHLAPPSEHLIPPRGAPRAAFRAPLLARKSTSSHPHPASLRFQ